MNTYQTTSDSLHPPVIAGVPTGGESRGFFASMNTNEPFIENTLDWYREKGKANEDIAVLVGLIDRMQNHFVNSVIALSKERQKTRQCVFCDRGEVHKKSNCGKIHQP